MEKSIVTYLSRASAAILVFLGGVCVMSVACLGRDLPSFEGKGGGGNGGAPQQGGGGAGGVSCDNDQIDGDETDTDCGGGMCPKCPPNSHCGDNDDCLSGRCVDQVCAAPCNLSDLALYYSFEAGLTDESGQGHNGLGTDVTSAASGKFGKALSFNGTTSLLLATGAGDLAGARTLCAWIRPDSVGGPGQPIFAAGTVGAADFFSLQSDIPGGSCSTAPADTIFQEHSGSPCVGNQLKPVANGQWSLVCFANDGSGGGRFAINGSVLTLAVDVYSYGFDTLSIGSTQLSSSSTQASFKGLIDEVTVWNRALDANELSLLYGAGLGCTP